MQLDPVFLEARRDALLDEVEAINIIIYEQRLVLESLAREIAEEQDSDPEWVAEH